MVIYLAISLVFWWQVWVTGDPTSSITCGCGDTAQGVWWMEWVPWALQHGHTPFLSQQLFSRSGGVSALANTSALLLSLIFAPLTMLAGPVASFNLANLLAPVTSGVAMFLAAARVTRLFPARLIAGAVYAFSPFMLRNTVIGHLQLTWAFYPPLVFLLVMKLISDPKAKAVKIGVQLGILTILQFFIGMETIALTGIAGAVAVLVALALAPRDVLRLWQPLVRALTAAAAVAGIALGLSGVDLPLWAATRGGTSCSRDGSTFGRDRQSGEQICIRAMRRNGRWATWAPVGPPSNTWVSPFSSSWLCQCPSGGAVDWECYSP